MIVGTDYTHADQSAELDALDGSGPGSAPPVRPPVAQGEPVEGISVSALTDALRSRYNVPDTLSGVVITDVARSTPAARLGLQAGLVITRVNMQNVSSAAEFRAAVAAAKQAGRPSVLLFIRTPQGTATVPLKFDDGE